ncbi:MAG: YraN family protein [Tannerellaceae bacterium]|jgi:putative endonuclease|nr:YraN family protein [Tannerellaceae bacterium]
MKSHTAIGYDGERCAKDFLLEKGYKILDTNWRWHKFELDIVALDGEMLVIVEVKTRSANRLVEPEDAVNRRKIRRLTLAADSYARRMKEDHPVRFDIITVITDRQGDYTINHIEDAYWPPVG